MGNLKRKLLTHCDTEHDFKLLHLFLKCQSLSKFSIIECNVMFLDCSYSYLSLLLKLVINYLIASALSFNDVRLYCARFGILIGIDFLNEVHRLVQEETFDDSLLQPLRGCRINASHLVKTQCKLLVHVGQEEKL